MSFWSTSSCQTWLGLVSSWITSHPPQLLESPPLHPIHPIRGCTFGKATEADLQQLPAFWEQWFSTTSRCSIPLSAIKSRPHWDIVVARRGNEVIGTLVRRWIVGLHIKEAYMPKAGVIDFFCVHPAWRKKGIGRSLLYLIQNQTPRPIPPHLMLWETYVPTIPPVAAGSYWRKEFVPRQVEGVHAPWPSVGRSIWSEPGSDVHIYPVEGGHVYIWNTWHRRIPQGDAIGIVMACTGKIETVQSPFGLLLADTKYEGWEYNGPFQWGLYMMNAGFISTEFPLLGL